MKAFAGARRCVAVVCVALTLLLTVSPGFAGRGGGDGRGGGGHSQGGGKHHGGGTHSHGGHFHHKHFHHGGSAFFFRGGPWWWGAPYWYSPYYYYPPVYRYVPPPEPPVYFQRSPDPAYWYYCQDLSGYYPDVPQCPTPWLKVLPRP
jgi:hypothetical protein